MKLKRKCFLIFCIISVSISNPYKLKEEFYNIQINIPDSFDDQSDFDGDIPILKYQNSKRGFKLVIVTGLSSLTITDSIFLIDYCKHFEIKDCNKIKKKKYDNIEFFTFKERLVKDNITYESQCVGAYYGCSIFYGYLYFVKNKKNIILMETILNDIAPIIISKEHDFVKIHPIASDWILSKVVEFGYQKIHLNGNYNITNEKLINLATKVDAVIISNMPQIKDSTINFLKSKGITVILSNK